jgi:ribosomal protein S2
LVQPVAAAAKNIFDLDRVLPFDKYHQLHIGTSTREQTFTMQYVDNVRYDLRYFDLRKLIEKYEEQHR